MRAWRTLLGGIAGLWVGLGLLHAQLAGIDTGAKAQDIAKWDESTLREWGGLRPWLRIRGHPIPPTQEEAIDHEIAGLRDLCREGFRPVIFLRWSEKSWQTGIRPGGGQRLPLDLREIFQRAAGYGRIYGATGAAFEIENEPDISFVQENPETYMAFLKAAYLGIKCGAIDSEAVGDKPKVPSADREIELRAHPLGPRAAVSSLIYRKQLGRRGGAWESLSLRDPAAYRLPLTAERGVDAPLVIMAPLALPPGPYFEQLVINGLFSYTDTFNYHYYGYADDFSGAYRQFENAVVDVGWKRRISPDKGMAGLGDPVQHSKKSLPVLLTEYGYGSLSGEDRDTVEGRMRQWRWFKSVGEQIRKLRIAGPMAFYLPPYLEGGALEFGLTMPARRVAESNDVERGLRALPNDSKKAGFGSPVLQSAAGTMRFSPQDFGLRRSAPWMARIGQKFGQNEATPALAWLLDEDGRKPYRPKHWTVHAYAPSPVVIDFIAGEGLVQQKRYGGYVAVIDRDERLTANARQSTINSPPLTLNAAPAKSGHGQILLYNFYDAPMQGRLEIIRGRELLVDAAAVERIWTLEPMARVVVPVMLAVPAHEFTRHELALRFVSVHNSAWPVALSDNARSSVPRSQLRSLGSVFSTFFYPEASNMREILLHDFSSQMAKNQAHKNAELLARRSLAAEEPQLQPTGRWNATRGVKVEELDHGIWRFHIADFPQEPNKPAMAELPLPDDFAFLEGEMMKFDYRLAQPAGTTIANGKYFEAYFRTANGNLYQVWPRQYATAAWQGYTEIKENYTMAFYGRANLAWRFRDNRPVALVFFFRPGRAALPAIYEVKRARIVEFMAPGS